MLETLISFPPPRTTNKSCYYLEFVLETRSPSFGSLHSLRLTCRLAATDVVDALQASGRIRRGWSILQVGEIHPASASPSKRASELLVTVNHTAQRTLPQRKHNRDTAWISTPSTATAHTTTTTTPPPPPPPPLAASPTPQNPPSTSIAIPSISVLWTKRRPDEHTGCQHCDFVDLSRRDCRATLGHRIEEMQTKVF